MLLCTLIFTRTDDLLANPKKSQLLLWAILIKTDVSRGSLDKTAESLQIETDSATSEVFIARFSVLNWLPGELQNQGWPWGQTIQVYFILVGLCPQKVPMTAETYDAPLVATEAKCSIKDCELACIARSDINQWIWRTRSWLHFPLFFGGLSPIKRLIGTLLWGSIRAGQAVTCRLSSIRKQTGHFERIYINSLYQQRRMPRMSVFPIREASLWDRKALLGYTRRRAHRGE